jgi:hypothetical protein
MLIFTFQPILDFIVEYLLMLVYRWYYRNWVYDNKQFSEQSKMNVSNNFLKFLDLYAGPEYCFHQKAANTNMIVIICLIFGACYPILYWIGVLAIAIQYFMERVLLTYFYRLPPKFTTKITQ